jgi:hypothetical protein
MPVFKPKDLPQGTWPGSKRGSIIPDKTLAASNDYGKIDVGGLAGFIPWLEELPKSWREYFAGRGEKERTMKPRPAKPEGGTHISRYAGAGDDVFSDDAISRVYEKLMSGKIYSNLKRDIENSGSRVIESTSEGMSRKFGREILEALGYDTDRIPVEEYHGILKTEGMNIDGYEQIEKGVQHIYVAKDISPLQRIEAAAHEYKATQRPKGTNHMEWHNWIEQGERELTAKYLMEALLN